MRSSTEIERAGLLSEINFADGHARQSLSQSQLKILEQFPLLFLEAESKTIDELENSFISSFLSLANEVNIGADRTMYAYSSSCCISIVSTLLSQQNRDVGLLTPCFDNIYKLLSWNHSRISAIPETNLLNLDSITALAKKVGAIWITLPNNPTGFSINRDQFKRIANICYDNDVIFVVDMSFRLFDPSLDNWSVYKVLELSKCSFVVIEDTGKAFKTLDMKVGFSTCSSDLVKPLYHLYDDLLLSVSEFHLLLLTRFTQLALAEGIDQAIRKLISENRNILRSIFESESISKKTINDSLIPLEWIEFTGNSMYTLAAFMENCRNDGLHLLPGDNFFWDRRSEDGKYFRIPLARDPEYIKRGLEIMQRYL